MDIPMVFGVMVGHDVFQKKDVLQGDELRPQEKTGQSWKCNWFVVDWAASQMSRDE